ncbi:MAG: hypothetical protein CME88_03260 [Hirschia sp.]|nr:hypothetical protein [Hirschia sp.]
MNHSKPKYTGAKKKGKLRNIENIRSTDFSILDTLISVTHDFPAVRYSTNPPLKDWSSEETPLLTFMKQQTSLGVQISEHLKNEGDAKELVKLLAQYVSQPFDLFGHSISTPGLADSLIAPVAPSDEPYIETMIATCYGARNARIGVAGTSQINQGMLIAARRARPSRDLILHAGNEHASFLMGSLSANIRLARFQTEIDSRTGLQKLDIYDSLERALNDHSEQVLAVFLTQPTYEGLAIDLKDIHALCKANGCFLIIDGAWSGMWGVDPAFPPSPIQHCDMMSVSLHKAGLAPCQVSAALFNDDSLLAAHDEISAMGLSTTSPNFLLLSAAQLRFGEVVCTSSAEQWKQIAEDCSNVRSELEAFDPSLFHLDAALVNADYLAPNNLVLFTHEANINARQVASILFEQYGRIVETASDHCMQLIFSPGNHRSSQALTEDIICALVSAKTQSFPLKPISQPSQRIAPEVTRPAEMFFAQSEPVRLPDAVGRTASSAATISPPCQPLWEPGSLLTQSVIDKAMAALVEGQVVDGLTWSGDTPAVRVTACEPDYTIRTLTTPIIDPELVRELARTLTGGWAGPPYNHAFVHENDPHSSLSPSSYLELTTGTHMVERSWYECDEIEQIELQPGWHRVIDRHNYEKVLEQRLSDSGYLTLVRDRQGKLKGIFHCRSGVTIDRLIDTEEWCYGNMMCTTLPEIVGSRQHILNGLQFHFGLSQKHKVNAISTQILHPSLRGGSALHDMIKDLAYTMTPEHARLPLLCELSDEPSPSRVVNEATLERVVYNVLPPENGHCLGYSSRMSNALFYYMADRPHWTYAVKEQVRKSRNVFFRQPEDHHNLKVIETTDGRGLGVYATRTGIEAGEIVARFTGETYQSESACALHPIMVNHAIQTGPNTFVFAKHSIAHLINASHAPNLGLHDSTALVALRRIEPGEELTWSYEMSEDSDWCHTPCLCGADCCPGFIGTFSDLPEDLQESYIKSGIASDWIIRRNR